MDQIFFIRVIMLMYITNSVNVGSKPDWYISYYTHLNNFRDKSIYHSISKLEFP